MKRLLAVNVHAKSHLKSLSYYWNFHLGVTTGVYFTLPKAQNFLITKLLQNLARLWLLAGYPRSLGCFEEQGKVLSLT